MSCANLNGHVREVTGHADRGSGAWFLRPNIEMLARCARKPDYWDLIKKADVITADGMPLVWASGVKYPGAAIDGRTTGVDLVAALLRMQSVPRFALIGGKSPLKTNKPYGPTAMKACAFVFDGKVDLSDDQLVLFCNELTRHQARVVFIALGVPKQDQLAVQLRQQMPPLVLLRGHWGYVRNSGARGRPCAPVDAAVGT